MLIPPLESLNKYFPSLARMVAETSWLPHPDTVSALGRAAFPTSRARRLHPRFSEISKNGAPIGMYDDNMTPRWAILWAHGIIGGKSKGWAFAHVWPVSDDVNSYTHLANLAMVPECFASLTDKQGPLAVFLRWHSWSVYGWKPTSEQDPEKPENYEQISWRYLDKFDDPRGFIRRRVLQLKNKRVVTLRSIMERLGML